MIDPAKLLLLSLACSISSPAVGQSFSREQRNAMNHLAQAGAIVGYCPQYELRDGFKILVIGYNIDWDQSAVQTFITARMLELLSGLRAAGDELGCQIGYALYGPGGKNVPDLVRRK